MTYPELPRPCADCGRMTDTVFTRHKDGALICPKCRGETLPQSLARLNRERRDA